VLQKIQTLEFKPPITIAMLFLLEPEDAVVDVVVAEVVVVA
jgi:hypothetical protein